MKQLKIIGPLFIIIAASLWGFDGIVLRPALYSLPVPLVVLVEHGLAFFLMLPFFIKEAKEVKKLKAPDWGAFFWVAIFGGALGTMFITKALFYVQFVNLSVVVLIQKLQPVFALLLAALILKEKLPKKFFGWAGLAIVATYFVAFPNFLPNFATGDKTVAAALFSLGAAFAFGSSTVFSKRALQKVSYRLGTYLRFGLTTVLMFFITLGFGDLGAVTQITSKQFLIFLAIVFSSGAAAMFLYYYGLKWVTASVSTICELAFPLSAIILEFLIRGRLLTWSQWLGALVLFVAIYQVSTIQQRMAKSA
ncbi:MAG: DMT family transporter [Patescibacteria group bacterium]|jgi:drug/metabolite transporter (DMT)-like permease